MKNPNQAGWWSCTTGWAAAVVTLAASLAVTPSIARAVCDADCDGNGTVTVNEVVTVTNVILGTAEATACASGIPSGTAPTVATAVSGVNNALHGCPAAGVCGDGTVQSGEDCDPGSICIGGDNAGTPCTQESDCMGDGVCDTFGQKGSPGTIPRKACSADDECGGAKCIHCKTFSKDGCANNCSTEMVTRIKLVPGDLENGDIKPGTSGAFVHGDPFMVPLTLNGINTLRSGSKASANGVIPIAQRPDGVELDRIPITTLACACVRGTVYRTCGGTQYEKDGMTASTDCTFDDSVCAGKKPCTAVAGAGNSGEGVLGCASTGLPSVGYTITQDAGGTMCPVEVTMCDKAGPAIYTPGPAGPPGSQILAAASQIGTVTGQCTGTDTTMYGEDGEFCTDDDPLIPTTVRGLPSITTLVTGTASSAITNADGVNGNNLGPYSISGTVKSCEDVVAGNTAGAAQAGAFTAAGLTRNETLGDTANVNVFVSQCNLPADPNVTTCP